MPERRYRDTRSRSRSPPFRGRRSYSPPAPRRYREVSPLSHRHHGAENERLRMHPRYMSGKSRVEPELSPPVRRRRGYSPSLSPPPNGKSREEPELSPPMRRRRGYSPSLSPPPHRRVQRSATTYGVDTNEPVHSRRFHDSHLVSASLGASSDRRMERTDRESYTKRQYEADRYTNGYGKLGVQRDLGVNEHSSYIDSTSNKFDWKYLLPEKREVGDSKLSHRTSTSERVYQGREVSDSDGALSTSLMKDGSYVRNGYFPSSHGPCAVVDDKYGFCDSRSFTGCGLGGDGTQNYGKKSTREPSREEIRSKFDYVDDLRSAVPTAQIHAPVYPNVKRDRLSVCREEVAHDDWREMRPVRPAYEELMDTGPSVISPIENIGREYACSEERDMGRNFNSLPDRYYYESLESVREKYGLQGTSKTSPVNNLADKFEKAGNYGGEYSRGSRQVDDQHYAGGESYSEVQDEMYESGTPQLRHSGEQYLDYEPSHVVEDDGIGEGGGPWPYGHSFNDVSLLEDDEEFLDVEGSYQRRLTDEELRQLGSSENPVKQKRGFDKRRLGYIGEGELSRNLAASDIRYEDEGRIDSNANRFYGRLQYGGSDRTSNLHLNIGHAIYEESDLFSDGITKTKEKYWRHPEVPPARDIKKRLGPSLGKLEKTTYPWVKTYASVGSQYDRFGHSSHGGGTLGATADEVESNENQNLNVARADPPEDSEEFAQLVNSAFLKFFKKLNENEALRRKIADQGRSGGLKCSICGRNSKEFIDTLSLAMHAFSTRAAGFRTDHLGLHKALCTLMGWNSAVGPNGTWARQELPDAEALALREDIIIWPPVVIIHNSSIANTAADDRLIVDIEEMHDILREMGLGRDIIKVVRGKAANQSIMVVSFLGTFSGLSEVESLHKYFIKNARGRIEFDHKCSNKRKALDTGIAPKDKVSVLYGYLGVAKDLDKLDFETKKRCLVKSRKEIQGIVDCQLN